MPNRTIFRLLLLVVLLAAASLGCQLVNNIRQGVEIVGTGQAVATEFGALSTELIPPGIEETAQALITEVDTSGIMETAQAAITEQAPEIGETAQALTTEIYTAPEDAPPDIPIMEGETSAFVGSKQAISYFIDAEFDEVVNFYKNEMPANGWQEAVSEGFSNENMTEMEYTKGGRKAILVITQVPFVGQTTVVITIEGE